MEAHYSGIGNDLAVRFSVSDLSKKDQIAMLHDLMRRVGYTDVLYSGKPDDERKELDAAFHAAARAFEKSAT